jgi:hypothetical protein
MNALQVVAPNYLNDDDVPYDALNVSQTYLICTRF